MYCNVLYCTALYCTLLHCTAPHSPSLTLLCSVLYFQLLTFSTASLTIFSTASLTTGPEGAHLISNMNPNGTMNVFNLSALQMSRSVSGSGSGSDYHMSDEEASVGTQRDFIWGVIMGYFLGMYCTCCVVIHCALLYCTDCTE